MKFSMKDFFSKCDQIHSFLRIWSHLLKKPLMENFILWAGWMLWLLLTMSTCNNFIIPKCFQAHFMPLFSFYTPWKLQKTIGFLMFQRGIERNHWHETVQCKSVMPDFSNVEKTDRWMVNSLNAKVSVI